MILLMIVYMRGVLKKYCLNSNQLQMAYDSFMTISQPTIELSPEEAEEYVVAKSDFTQCAITKK